MGCGSSTPAAATASEEASPDGPVAHLRVLLLGSSGSGKSTFCKQLLRHFGGGFTEQEVLEAGYNVQSNCLQRMNNTLSSDSVKLDSVGCVAAKEKLNEAAQCEFEYIDGNFFMGEIGKCMNQLWAEENVKGMASSNYFKAPWDFQFFEDIPRIFSTDYQPTDDDVVAVRSPTTGLMEYEITTNVGLQMTMVDVGGKRNDRSMWHEELERSDAIIFFITLTDYANQQSLIGDTFSYLGNDAAVKHRYLENLQIFGKVFASAKMDEIPFFVIFTKPDLFEDMIKSKEPAMKEEYPDYTGGEDAASAEDFLRHKMHRVAQVANFSKSEELPSFVVNLQETEQFVEIFEKVHELLYDYTVSMMNAEAQPEAQPVGEIIPE